MTSEFSERSRNVNQLRELLADADLAQVARYLLGVPVAAPKLKPDVTSSPNPGKHTAIVSPKKKRGDLQRAVLQVINKSEVAMSAKDVAAKMDADNYPFEASDKQIAVSKVLRKLKDQERIDGEKTTTDGKSAFIYSSLKLKSREAEKS